MMSFASKSPTPASESLVTTCRASSSGSTASTRPAAASSAAPDWAFRSSSTWLYSLGGQIDVASRLGSGSRFQIRLPRAAVVLPLEQVTGMSVLA